jgi:putative ABC transport system ATP-binding protein
LQQPEEQMPPLIRLEGIEKTYGTGDARVLALRGVALSIEAGEFVAIIGPSGSGKSTLMQIIGCLDQPTAGRYWLGGADVARLGEDQLAAVRRATIGFVFQQYMLLPRVSALENVLMPMRYSRRRDAPARAAALLAGVGMGERSHHQPHELSGGQQQRVAIARALANEPRLLLADEPTGALDSATSAEVLALLRRLNVEQGLTVVLITHDPEVAREARRVVTVRDGSIVDDRVTAQPVEEVLV